MEKELGDFGRAGSWGDLSQKRKSASRKNSTITCFIKELSEKSQFATGFAFCDSRKGDCGGVPTIFRAWYRCIPHADNNRTDRACTVYAESSGGITWHKPELGLIDFEGSTANNLVIDDPDLVNFSPFLDEEAPAEERYKGIGRRGAIFTATSPDGLHLRKNREPMQTEGPFDSHNIAFRDPWTGRYVMYNPRDAPRGRAGPRGHPRLRSTSR